MNSLQTCQNPKCRKQLWKYTGCLYLLCDTSSSPPGCGEAMCWLCQGKWDSSHGDHFRCSKYEKQLASKTLSGAAKEAFQVRNRIFKNEIN